MVSWRKERGLGKEGKGGKDGEVGTQGLFVRDQFLEKSGKKERENSIKGGKEEKEVEIGERHTHTTKEASLFPTDRVLHRKSRVVRDV